MDDVEHQRSVFFIQQQNYLLVECFAFVVISHQPEQFQQSLTHFTLEHFVIQLKLQQFWQHFSQAVEFATVDELFFVMLEEGSEALEAEGESRQRHFLRTGEKNMEVSEEEVVELGEEGLEAEGEGQGDLEEERLAGGCLVTPGFEATEVFTQLHFVTLETEGHPHSYHRGCCIVHLSTHQTLHMLVESTVFQLEGLFRSVLQQSGQQ